MYLAFGGARAYGAPADQVANVLRGNHVQKFAASRHAGAVDFDQQLARDAQAFVDTETLIQVRVVDQAFPAYRGAWFFKVNAHDDFQRVFVLFALGLQTARVVQRSSGVVDRARAHHHQQAVVLTGHDFGNALAGLADQFFDSSAGNGKEADQMFGWRQHGDVLDALVVGLAGLVIDGRIRIFGMGFHERLLENCNCVKDKFGNKKKPPGAGGRLGSSERCLRSDLSTAGGA